MTLAEALLTYHREHVVQVDPLEFDDTVEVSGAVWLEWVRMAECVGYGREAELVAAREVATLEAACARKAERQRDALLVEIKELCHDIRRGQPDTFSARATIASIEGAGT